MKLSVLCLLVVTVGLSCGQEDPVQLPIRMVDVDIECPEDHEGEGPCVKKMCEVCVPDIKNGKKTCDEHSLRKRFELNYEGALNMACIICGGQGRLPCDCSLMPKEDEKCPGEEKNEEGEKHNNKND